MNIKKNNKGFTLVELIIVIAIIAILSVVVAPQYLKYVDKARVTVDDNAIAEFVHAAEVVSLTSVDGFVDDQVFHIHVDDEGQGKIPDAELAGFPEEVVAILDPLDYTFVSNKYKGHTVKVTVTSGLVTSDVVETPENPDT